MKVIVRVFCSTPGVGQDEYTHVPTASHVVDAITEALAKLSDNSRLVYLTARPEVERVAADAVGGRQSYEGRESHNRSIDLGEWKP